MNDSMRQKLYLGSLGILIIAAGSYFFLREGSTAEAEVIVTKCKIDRAVPPENPKIKRPRVEATKPPQERRVREQPQNPNTRKKTRPGRDKKKPEKKHSFRGA